MICSIFPLNSKTQLVNKSELAAFWSSVCVSFSHYITLPVKVLVIVMGRSSKMLLITPKNYINLAVWLKCVWLSHVSHRMNHLVWCSLFFCKNMQQETSGSILGLAWTAFNRFRLYCKIMIWYICHIAHPYICIPLLTSILTVNINIIIASIFDIVLSQTTDKWSE